MSEGVEHRELRRARRLRQSIRSGAARSALWLAVGVGSAGVAWSLAGPAIAIRLLPAVLALVAGFGSIALMAYAFGGNGEWLRRVVVLAALGAFAYTAWMTGSPFRTQAWYAGVVVLLAWLAICGIQLQEAMRDLRRDLRDLRESRHRFALDSRDGERGERLMLALEGARQSWNSSHRDLPLDRVLYFGDPILEPQRVVVWAIHPGRADPRWLADYAGNTAVRLLSGHVEMQLREIGYPCALAVGVAPAEEVDLAADDMAYFGEDGRRREPQDPAQQAYLWR